MNQGHVHCYLMTLQTSEDFQKDSYHVVKVFYDQIPNR